VSLAADPDQSSRAAALVERLRQVSEVLISLVGSIEPDRWMHVPRPGVWSPGKDAEHVADGAASHQWTIRFSLGHKVPAPPRIERSQLTAQRSQRDVVDLLRQRTNDSVALIAGLTEEELDLPVRPLRARSRTLAAMIERVLIGHYEVHRTEIEAKLRGQSG
jgi:hypothetical protein